MLSAAVTVIADVGLLPFVCGGMHIGDRVDLIHLVNLTASPAVAYAIVSESDNSISTGEVMKCFMV